MHKLHHGKQEDILKDYPEQALRVSWRIVKDWVEAQMAIVEAQLADMAEVFLPYAVTKNGNTLYESFKSGTMKLLN